LSALSAAAALEAGRNVTEALTMVEAGRELMIGIAANLRTDLPELETADPQ